MKIRALIILWLVALCALAMCGAGTPDIGLSGANRMAMGLKNGLGQGSSNAGFDTVAVFMSTQALADSAGYPVGAFRLPNSPDADDVARVAAANVFLKLPNIQKVRLGEASNGADYDAPTFAYCDIDSAAASGYRHASGTQNLFSGSSAFASDGITALNLSAPSATTRIWHLIYIPWETILPANVTVVSAKIVYQLSATAYVANTDTVIATNLDNPNDNWWYKNKRYLGNAWNMSESSYSRQWTSFWGGSNGHPWSPELKSRSKLWDFGKISDWTSVAAGSSSLASKKSLTIDVTNCAQNAVDHGVNNGIIITYADRDAWANISVYQWDNRGGNVYSRTPFVLVKYITKKNPESYNLWFVASTDDGKYPANVAYTDTFTAYNGKYSIYMAKNQINSGTGAMTPAQIKELHDRGMEISPHSKYHKSGGLTFWHRAGNTMADTTKATWDSLKVDASPKWFYNLGDSLGYSRSDPNWGKTIALPENLWSPEVELVVAKMRYRGARIGTGGAINNTDKFFIPVLGSYRATKTDTAVVGMAPTAVRYKRNMVMMPNTNVTYAYFGRKVNVGTGHVVAHLDSIKTNFRRAAFTAIGNDSRCIRLYWHDLKTNPSNGSYTDGVDASELKAALVALTEFNTRIGSLAEYTTSIQAASTPVATPAAFAMPDTFKFTAEQGVWYLPDGVDDRWIRGVR